MQERERVEDLKGEYPSNFVSQAIVIGRFQKLIKIALKELENDALSKRWFTM